MRNWKSAVLFVAAMFGGISSAFARVEGPLNIVIEPLFDSAIYSAPGKDQFVGWTVNVKNISGATSRPALFFGRTVVRDRKERAVFDNYYFSAPNPDPRCRSTNLFPTVVGCVIPGLLPNQSLTYTLSYKTPKKALNGVFDVEAPFPSDYVNFRGTTIGAQNHDIFVDRDLTNRVSLLSPNDTQVSAVCPPGGCTVFTGNNGGAPTTADPFVTEVVLPSTAPSALVSIRESVVDDGGGEGVCGNESYSGFLRTIFRTDITIPNTTFPTFPYLKIFLRVDRTQACEEGGFGEGAASGIRIFYYPDDGGERVLVQNCDGPPSADVPCIFNTRVIGGEDDFTGDYEAELRGKKNGGYRVE